MTLYFDFLYLLIQVLHVLQLIYWHSMLCMCSLNLSNIVFLAFLCTNI